MSRQVHIALTAVIALFTLVPGVFCGIVAFLTLVIEGTDEAGLVVMYFVAAVVMTAVAPVFYFAVRPHVREEAAGEKAGARPSAEREKTDFLLAELDRWLGEGLISTELHESLGARYSEAASPPETPAPAPPAHAVDALLEKRRPDRPEPAPTPGILGGIIFSEQAIKVILVLGAFLTVISGLIFTVYRWSTFPLYVKVVILSLFTLALYGVGAAFMRRLRPAGMTLVSVASFMLLFDAIALYRFILADRGVDLHVYWIPASLLLFAAYAASAVMASSSFFSYPALLALMSTLWAIPGTFDASTDLRVTALMAGPPAMMAFSQAAARRGRARRFTTPAFVTAHAAIPPLLVFALGHAVFYASFLGDSSQLHWTAASWLLGTAAYAVGGFFIRHVIYPYLSILTLTVGTLVLPFRFEASQRWFVAWVMGVSLVYAAAGQVFRRVECHFRWPSPVIAFRLPLLIFGYMLGGIAAVSALGDRWLFAFTMFALLVMYAEATVFFRSPAWLYPAQVALSLCLLSSLAPWDAGQNAYYHVYPFMGIYIATLLTAYSLEKRGHTRWGLPLYAVGIVGSVMVYAVSFIKDETVMDVGMAYAALMALFAVWRRSPWLLYGATSSGFVGYMGMLAVVSPSPDYSILPYFMLGYAAALYVVGFALGMTERRRASLPFRVSGLVVAFLAALFSLAVNFDDLPITIVVMASLGVLLSVEAMLLRSEWLGYVASLPFLGVYFLLMAHLGIEEVQAYALALGAYFIGIHVLQRMQGRPALVLLSGFAAMAVAIPPAFFQSLGEDDAFLYALLMGTEGMAAFVYGLLQRRRSFLFIGTVTVVVDAVVQVWDVVHSLPWWAITGAIGITLLAVGIAALIKRERVVQIHQLVSAELDTWAW